MTSALPERERPRRPGGRPAAAKSGATSSAADHAGHRSRAGLPGAHGRRELGPAEGAAAEHRRRVAHPGHHQREEDQPGAGPASDRELRACRMTRSEGRQRAGIGDAEQRDRRGRERPLGRRAAPRAPRSAGAPSARAPRRAARPPATSAPIRAGDGASARYASGAMAAARRRCPSARAGRTPRALGQVEQLRGSRARRRSRAARRAAARRTRPPAVRAGSRRRRTRSRRDQLGVHQAETRPNRRSRRWNSRIASNRWRRVKSGQSTGVTYSSA